MKHTIRSNTEVNSLFKDAPRSIQKNLIVLSLDEPDECAPGGRVAYLAGKRLGNAPRRNRAKRLLREAARAEGAPWPRRRVVLVAREACLGAGLEEVRRDIAKGLRHLAHMGPKPGAHASEDRA
jgi:ribonuclease P protein component